RRQQLRVALDVVLAHLSTGTRRRDLARGRPSALSAALLSDSNGAPGEGRRGPCPLVPALGPHEPAGAVAVADRLVEALEGPPLVEHGISRPRVSFDRLAELVGLADHDDADRGHAPT